jgi:hypothetical protein
MMTSTKTRRCDDSGIASDVHRQNMAASDLGRFVRSPISGRPVL